VTAPPELSLLDDQLLTLLRAVALPNGDLLPVGDMEIPHGGGWSGAGPNAPSAQFTGYGILYPQPTGPAYAPSFGQPQANWQVPYILQSYGATREQARFIGELMRPALLRLHGTVVALGASNYRLDNVSIDSLGAPERVPGTNPAYFGQQERVTFWLAKRRT